MLRNSTNNDSSVAGGHYIAMKGGANPLANFEDWDAARLGAYFQEKGMGEYAEVLKKHKITGRLAPLLSDNDLKDMGINIVGDRLNIKHCLKELKRTHRFNKRIETLWEGKERLFFSEYHEKTVTCFGMCPIDPSTYRLTVNHLKVNRVVPARCGPVPLLCLEPRYTSNNVDLSKVDDVDVIGVPAPCMQRVCCMAKGKDIVRVESRFEHNGEKLYLSLPQGAGEVVSALILNQVEESQKMERS